MLINIGTLDRTLPVIIGYIVLLIGLAYLTSPNYHTSNI